MNKLNVITDFVVDACKIADKKDFFKDFLNENDELLSSSSWGKLVKYLGQKAVEISEPNEAYFFTIYTSYLNTFIEGISNLNINENNFSIPTRTTIQYDYNEFDLAKITTNTLKLYFDVIFKEFVAKEDRAKVQKYINNNLKYNYLLVLKQNSSVLQKYLNHIKSDLGIEKKNNFNKNIYQEKIVNEYFDVVLGDEYGLTLDDLYIEPNFRVHKNCFSGDDKRVKVNDTREKYIDVKDESIHKFIDDILENRNAHNLDVKDVDTIFIAGQPGQGKSSFSKRFVYDSINDKTSSDKEIIFIKLKNISEPTDLLNKTLKNIVKESVTFEIDNLDDYIIVLDGLDELAMKTGLSLNDIDTICHRLSKVKTTKIITTRHGYVKLDSLSDDNIVIVELRELNKSQQLDWLGKYKSTYKNLKLSNETINKIHKDKNEYILELINQPILLHMIANMDIENIEDLNKTKLYSEFFELLIKRRWEKDAHTLSKVKGVNQENYTNALKNMLAELAFNIFNSDFEYIQKHEFEKLQSVKDLQELLSDLNSNETLKTNLKGVMVSFYFKEVHKDENDDNTQERNEHYAIEFLHKSLMEYMVSTYIYDTLKEEFLETKRKTGKYVIESGKDALEILWKLFHKKEISAEIQQNLVYIIEEDVQNDRDGLAKRLDEFLPYLVAKDFLYFSAVEDDNPMQKANNTFYGFWNVLSSLDNKNHMPKDLSIKQKLFNKISLYTNYPHFDVSNIDVSNLRIYNMILENNLKHMNFEDAKLVNVSILNIISGILRNSNLYKVDKISYSFIAGVKFKNCKFEDVDLFNTTMEECKFENVIFDFFFIGRNVFGNCTFINCPEINFEELKEQNVVFINCTNDGEKI